MSASTTAGPLTGSVEMPSWKTLLNHAAALVVAFLFIAAGVYKAIDPYKFANLAHNLLVWKDWTLPLALGLAVAETTAGVLILIPRFRRWGAILAGFLLIAFMGYIGWNYKALIGRDCSCFPELRLPMGIVIDMRRSVGPGFFYGDLAFLAAAAIAGFWAKRSQGLRTAAVILGAIAVFTAVSYGSVYSKLTGLKAPDSIIVEGQPMALDEGKVFLFFYDPECGTCFAVGKSMAPVKFKSDVTFNSGSADLKAEARTVRDQGIEQHRRIRRRVRIRTGKCEVLLVTQLVELLQIVDQQKSSRTLARLLLLGA